MAAVDDITFEVIAYIGHKKIHSFDAAGVPLFCSHVKQVETCPCSQVVKALGRHMQLSVTRSVAGVQTTARARPPTKKNYFK